MKPAASALCPACEAPGVLGQPCRERACARQALHFIPAAEASVALSAAAAQRLGGEAARELVGVMAKDIAGGGGGRAELAWAGGKKADALAQTLQRFTGLVGERAGEMPA